MHSFVSKVEKYILEQNMINNGDTIVMGVSGGADSTALFLVLLELKEKYNLNLIVVHVNHGLREEAREEAKSVEKLCKDNGITFILKEYDVASIAKDLGIGTEEAGRKLRYEAFNEALNNEGKPLGKIAVAHNMSDQSETMLFHLFRGTGITGLSSIAPVRDNIIRPLLSVTRDEIEKYLSDCNTGFSTDKSNFSDEYTRNRIRNNILPLVKEHVSESSIEHMAETASQLREIDSFVRAYAKKTYEKLLVLQSEKEVVFEKEAYLKEEIYIKKLLIKMAIDVLVPQNRDITHKHIESVTGLSDSTGYHEVNLPYGLVGFCSYNEIGLKRNNKINQRIDAVKINSQDTIFISGVGSFVISIFNKDISFDPGRNKYTKCFDYDKIIKCLEIRSRKEGDYIVVNQDGGRKKLKSYYIDEKIPSNERDRIPVIADGNKVFWVVGYRISEDVKITSDTKTIIKITYVAEEK